MKSQANVGHAFEFSYPKLDTLILVEEAAGDVVIRATRNTFSESRKIAFARHLVEEGFINEDFRWRAGGLHPRVRWVIDRQWLIDRPHGGSRRNFALPLIGSATVAWLAMLVTLFYLQGH